MSAPLTPVSDLAYQARFILNDANLEFAEFAAHKIQADSEKITHDKAELVVANKSGQGYDAASTDKGPKLAGPTVTINSETIQKLLADLKNLGDEPELAEVLMAFVKKAVEDYEAKGVEWNLADVLKFFLAYASTVVAVKTPEVQQLFSDLMAVESEHELVSVLKKHVDSVSADPEAPAAKSLLATLLALLFLVIETQNLREETEAELSGMLTQLSFDQAEIDAQKTIKSSLTGVMGAGAGFGFTGAVTGAAAAMQLHGFRQGRVAIDLEGKKRGLQKEITKLERSVQEESVKFSQLKRERANIADMYSTKREELKFMRTNNDQTRARIHRSYDDDFGGIEDRGTPQERYRKPYDPGDIDTLRKDDRSAMQRMDAEETKLQKELDRLVARDNQLGDLEKDSDFGASVEKDKCYKEDLQRNEDELQEVWKGLDELGGSPDFWRNLGFAMAGMNNGSQIFENGFRFMGSKEDADKIRAQAKRDNFSQMAQAREQERTSGVGGLRTSVQNIVEALYRSDVETKAAVAQAIKG